MTSVSIGLMLELLGGGWSLVNSGIHVGSEMFDGPVLPVGTRRAGAARRRAETIVHVSGEHYRTGLETSPQTME